MNIFKHKTQIPKLVLNTLFPWKCLVCFKYTDNPYPLCDNCLKEIKTINYFCCPICNKRISPNKFQYCHSKENKILAYAAPLSFSDTNIKNLIYYFKYQNITSLSKPLATFLLMPLVQYKNIFRNTEWTIIPIPLHYLKERKRGFNQSRLLAQELIQYIPLEYNDKILIRIKNNQAQAKIKNRQQRFQNAQNIFSVNKEFISTIKNKNVILVDDIYTTGATINSAAIVLKQSGAKNVVALCLAKE